MFCYYYRCSPSSSLSLSFFDSPLAPKRFAHCSAVDEPGAKTSIGLEQRFFSNFVMIKIWKFMYRHTEQWIKIQAMKLRLCTAHKKKDIICQVNYAAMQFSEP